MAKANIEDASDFEVAAMLFHASLEKMDEGAYTAEFADIQHAEELILKHTPTSSVDALVMLDVVILSHGERSDDLDKRALLSVHEFVRQQAILGGEVRSNDLFGTA